jgi:hypothetical protein
MRHGSTFFFCIVLLLLFPIEQLQAGPDSLAHHIGASSHRIFKGWSNGAFYELGFRRGHSLAFSLRYNTTDEVFPDRYNTNFTRRHGWSAGLAYRIYPGVRPGKYARGAFFSIGAEIWDVFAEATYWSSSDNFYWASGDRRAWIGTLETGYRFKAGSFLYLDPSCGVMASDYVGEPMGQIGGFITVYAGLRVSLRPNGRKIG